MSIRQVSKKTRIGGGEKKGKKVRHSWRSPTGIRTCEQTGNGLGALIPNAVGVQNKRLQGVVVGQHLAQLRHPLHPDAVLAEVHALAPEPPSLPLTSAHVILAEIPGYCTLYPNYLNMLKGVKSLLKPIFSFF